MATRVVTGTIYYPVTNIPWPSCDVVFSLVFGFTAGGLVYPARVKTITTDSAGQFSTILAVPNTGTALYDIQLPGQSIMVNLAAGAATTLDALIASSSPAVDPDAVLAILDSYTTGSATRISSYPDGAPALSTDILPVSRANVNTRLTVNDINKLAVAKLVYNVKDYGAVGDGVIDDTTAIQAALNAGGGSRVFFPLGTYIISSTIKIINGTRLEGVSISGVFIKAAAGAAISMVESYSVSGGYSTTGIHLSDLAIDGNNVAVTGLTIGFAGSGFAFRDSIDRVNITRCQNGLVLNRCVYTSIRDMFVSGTNTVSTIGVSLGAYTQECLMENIVVCGFAVNINLIETTGVVAIECISYADADPLHTNTINLLKLTNSYHNNFINCYWENISATLTISEILLVDAVAGVFRCSNNRFNNCHIVSTNTLSTRMTIGQADSNAVYNTSIVDCTFLGLTVTAVAFANSYNTLFINSRALTSYSGNDNALPVTTGTDGGNALRITGAGKIGIGIASPLAGLDVGGVGGASDFRISRVGNPPMYLSISAVGGPFNSSNIINFGANVMSLQANGGALIGAYAGGGTGAPANGLAVSGAVGIGVATPAQLLHLKNGHLRMDQVAAPTAPTVAVNVAAGNLNGAYYYRISFVTALGETESGTVSAVVAPAAQQVDLSAIPVSADPAVTAREIYRTTAGGSTELMARVAKIADNTTTVYTDNIADGSLGVKEPRVNTTGGVLFNGTVRIGIADNASTAWGVNALRVNTGFSNSAVGMNALQANTGNQNSAMGQAALAANTTGNQNSALGQVALAANTTGNQNSAMGQAALNANTTGYNNSAMGLNALYSNTTGYNNSAIGRNAGRLILDGTGNLTSNTSVYLGTDTRALASGDVNEIVIGHNATGLGSNTVVLGNASIVTTALRGNVLVGTVTDGMTAGGSLAIAQDLAHRGTKAGFYNAAPIVQRAGAVQAAAPAGGTGTAAGGYDTAPNRDALINLVNEMRLVLVGLALMKGSA